MARVSDIVNSLEDTIVPGAALALPRRRPHKARSVVPPTPSEPLIEQWKADQKAAKVGWLKRWTSSQVAGYRLELIVGYLTLILFGWAAILAGIPVFSFTTPAGFAPIWGAAIMLFGLVSAIGAIRAGEEIIVKDPKNPTPTELRRQRVIRVFNRIELTGTIALFGLLGTYATILILVGNGVFDEQRQDSVDTATALANLARIAVGCMCIALASHPIVRMLWLIFRPGKLMTPVATLVEAVMAVEHSHQTKVHDVNTGPTGIVK